MARKRAKLSGQGIEAFFPEPGTQTSREEKNSSGKRKRRTAGRKKKAVQTTVPIEFREKVQALKEKVQQFKKLIGSGKFNDMAVSDLRKY